MNYPKFVEQIKKYVSDHVEADREITIHQVTKNNGLVYDGLCIVDPTVNVSPTIYLNPYYHRYLNGVPMEDIYADILDTYHSSLPAQNFDVSVFTDFSKAKENIVMKLVNRKRNEPLLQDVPHIPYLDLAIVFVCVVTEFVEEYATIQIHNEHLKYWGIKTHELYQIAMENTPKKLPYQFKNMDELLLELAPMSSPVLEQIPLYLLSNSQRVHGAICMVYPGLLDKIAESLNSNLIIIPSSIHEVLIVPESELENGYALSEYDNMIAEVNETQLPDHEILGEHAYRYNMHSGLIEY